jgi:hypothetical protein
MKGQIDGRDQATTRVSLPCNGVGMKTKTRSESQIQHRKWRGFSHILQKPQSIMVHYALQWHPQKKGQPCTTLRRATKAGVLLGPAEGHRPELKEGSVHDLRYSGSWREESNNRFKNRKGRVALKHLSVMETVNNWCIWIKKCRWQRNQRVVSTSSMCP